MQTTAGRVSHLLSNGVRTPSQRSCEQPFQPMTTIKCAYLSLYLSLTNKKNSYLFVQFCSIRSHTNLKYI